MNLSFVVSLPTTCYGIPEKPIWPKAKISDKLEFCPDRPKTESIFFETPDGIWIAERIEADRIRIDGRRIENMESIRTSERHRMRFFGDSRQKPVKESARRVHRRPLLIKMQKTSDEEIQ